MRSYYNFLYQSFKFVNIQTWDCYQLFLHTGSELRCNLSGAKNVCKICEFMTYNDYTMNIQFVNFYCSSTKLTANIVQGLCLFLTHICSMLKKQTNTKYHFFDFPADYFAVGLTVGLFLQGKDLSQNLIKTTIFHPQNIDISSFQMLTY